MTVEDSDSAEDQSPTLIQKLRAMSYGASRTLLRRTKSSPPIPMFRKAGSQESSDEPATNRSKAEARQQLPSSESERSGSVSSGGSEASEVFRRPSNVDGGIALSEIAVEEHVPDIITQFKSSQ